MGGWWAREDSNLQPDRYERMVYYAFDLLHLDGFDTRAAPLVERKRLD
jgi:bifunctional non-homologous end joining protein LigD